MSEMDDLCLHHLRGLFESEGENGRENIFDFFPGIVYVYSTDTRKLRYVNKKITDVLGFSYDDLKTWDHDFSKVIFKDDIDLVYQELEKFNQLKDEDSHMFRSRFNRKEGDWMHFHVSGKILKRDDAGKVISLLLVAQDIDQQIRSSEELRLIRELAEDNEELLQFGNWNWDPHTDQVQWSRGMYMMMDYNPDVQQPDLRMKSYLDHVLPQEREMITSVLDRAGKNKDTTVEFKYSITTHLQKEKIFYSKGKIIYDDKGEVKNIVGITRDITEPTRLYDYLDNYKQLVMEKEDFLDHGSWECDLTNFNINWSDGMFRLYGYDPAEKAKIKIDDAFYKAHFTPESYKQAKANLYALLENGGNNYIQDLEIKDKNGNLRMFESYGKIIRNRTGKGIQFIGTTRDVTQLKKYERELEHKIIELDRSNKELEDFAYAASHDLQEPLRKISTLGERLQTKFANSLQEEGMKYLQRIQTATKNARSLIDSLMEFSRITHESQTYDKTDMNALVQEVKSDLELKIEETQATIHSVVLPNLEVSAPQIKQLFTNIILNSIKFRKQDVAPVIDIRSRTLSKQEIHNFHLSPQRHFFLLEIKDNGIGFEEEYAQKIFQMFHRLHGKSEYPGAGIGLALCKKIVEHHHGVLFATSTPGEGATFSVILPENHSLK
jgi:PAS domain S-box-containing protein